MDLYNDDVLSAVVIFHICTAEHQSDARWVERSADNILRSTGTLGETRDNVVLPIGRFDQSREDAASCRRYFEDATHRRADHEANVRFGPSTTNVLGIHLHVVQQV